MNLLNNNLPSYKSFYYNFSNKNLLARMIASNVTYMGNYNLRAVDLIKESILISSC